MNAQVYISNAQTECMRITNGIHKLLINIVII